MIKINLIPRKRYKRCTSCKKLKPLKYFHRNKNHLDGYHYICKKCVQQYQKKYYRKFHPKKEKKYINKNWLKEQIKVGYTKQEIAKLCKVNYGTIYKYCKQFNLFKNERLKHGKKFRTCFKCKQLLSLIEFEKDSNSYLGYKYICKKCHKKYYKNWYKKNGRKRNKKAQKAAYILLKAIKNNKIIRPNNCEICGENGNKISGHHFDYSKPLQVIWVCPSCHRQIHSKNLQNINNIKELKLKLNSKEA